MTEFSIPVPLNVTKMADETVDCLVLLVMSSLFSLVKTAIKHDISISISTRRTNGFVLLVLMLILMPQVFSLASAAFELLLLLMFMS